jgi:periplasmic protein TonB
MPSLARPEASLGDDSLPRIASVAASAALHAAVLLFLIGRASPVLTLDPTPVVVSLAEVAMQTAGPGVPASSLTSPPPAAPAAPGEHDETALREPSPEKVAEPEAESLPVARPKPVAKAVPPHSAPAPAATRPVPSSAVPASAETDGTALAAVGGVGSDTRAAAPAFAATARVRYEQVLFAWLVRHKQFPLLAQRRGLGGAGSVRVRIDRDGRVLEHSIEASTGEPMLDDAALDMVRRSSPFPAVPPEYSGTSFVFVAPIEFRLR